MRGIVSAVMAEWRVNVVVLDTIDLEAEKLA